MAGGDIKAPQRVSVSITTGTMIRFVLVLFGVAFLYLVREALLIIIFASLLAVLINPFADYFETKRLPRFLAVLLIYLGLIIFLVISMYVLVPPVLQEIKSFSQSFGSFWQGALSRIGALRELSIQYGFAQSFERSINSLDQWIAGATSNIFATVTGAVRGIFGLVAVLVFALYLVVEKNVARQFVKTLAPEQWEERVVQIILKVQTQLGLWLRGQLTLSLLVGIFVYIGLVIMHVDNALVLAMFAAFAESFPYIGPIASAIPAALIGFAQSPIKGILVLVLFFFVQQLENNLLVPKIMQKVVGINPLVSLIALLLGAKLAGIAGALVALPVATALTVVVPELIRNRKLSIS